MRRGAPAGLVDGVPATIKDLVLTKGWPTLRGSQAVSPDQPWNEDARDQVIASNLAQEAIEAVRAIRDVGGAAAMRAG